MVAAAKQPRRHGARSSASTSATPRTAQAQALRAPLRRALPVVLLPGRPGAARVPRHADAPAPSRASWSSTREGRVAASIIGRLPSTTTLVDVVERRRDRQGHPRWVSGSTTPPPPGRSLLAMPVALVAGLVSFFSPCVIPLLPGYLSYATGLSGADLADGAPRPARPDARRLAALRARLLGRLRGHRRASRAPLGAWLVDLARHAHGRARRPDDPARPGLRGRVPGAAVAPARLARAPGARPSGWPPRPCSASSSASAGRPASGPPWPRSPRCRSTRPPPAAARCSPRCTPWGWACRSSSPAWPTGGRSAPSAFVRRHQAWVTRAGGLMLVAGRACCSSPAGGTRP